MKGPVHTFASGQEAQSKDFPQGVLTLENGLETSKTKGRSDSQHIFVLFEWGDADGRSCRSAGEGGERWRDSRNIRTVDRQLLATSLPGVGDRVCHCIAASLWASFPATQVEETFRQCPKAPFSAIWRVCGRLGSARGEQAGWPAATNEHIS